MRFDAVVLLSGGLDSATALFWALRHKGWRCQALSFDYGQRHRRELRTAREIARKTHTPLQEVKFRLPWGGSSLLDPHSSLPHHKKNRIGQGPIPSTYVPARNTLFLSFALSLADANKIRHIVIGANALDYSGYPDCRPAFLKAFATTARLGTRLGAEAGENIQICAPLLKLSKADIIRRGLSWGVPYQLTWSCYRGGKRPCGACDACQLRSSGFSHLGLTDPALT